MMLLAIILCLASMFFVGYKTKRVRFWGFIGLLSANAIWVTYGISVQDYWVVAQFGAFCITSLWGLWNNR